LQPTNPPSENRRIASSTTSQLKSLSACLGYLRTVWQLRKTVEHSEHSEVELGRLRWKIAAILNKLGEVLIDNRDADTALVSVALAAKLLPSLSELGVTSTGGERNSSGGKSEPIANSTTSPISATSSINTSTTSAQLSSSMRLPRGLAGEIMATRGSACYTATYTPVDATLHQHIKVALVEVK
jgi:hypothetical protein